MFFPKELNRRSSDPYHYSDVIMSAIASQITSLTLVCSTNIQIQIKENIKAPRHWPLCGEFTGEFPAQMSSNAENVWLRHHVNLQRTWMIIVTMGNRKCERYWLHCHNIRFSTVRYSAVGYIINTVSNDITSILADKIRSINSTRQPSEMTRTVIVRRAGLLWSQQDFEWRWSVPLFKCLTVLEFSFILFDLCLLITFFNFIMNYVPIVTFWIFTYHKIWILSIMFCFIWSYWIIYFLACLEVSWRVVS